MASLSDRIRHEPARALRRGLLGLVLLVSAAVAWNLLRPAPKAGAPATAAALAGAGAGTTVGDMAFLRFRDDSRKVEVKAREMVRQQGDVMLMRGVEAALPFVSEGRPGTVTIQADECQYQPGLERAAFKGNVQLRTDDGFELDSETLKYWGDKERAFTPRPGAVQARGAVGKRDGARVPRRLGHPAQGRRARQDRGRRGASGGRHVRIPRPLRVRSAS